MSKLVDRGMALAVALKECLAMSLVTSSGGERDASRSLQSVDHRSAQNINVSRLSAELTAPSIRLSHTAAYLTS